MDEQHRKLIDLINKMYRVMRKEETTATIEEVLDEMGKYAAHHLREEEALLQANNYEEFAEHSAGHQSYLNKMTELLAEWKTGDADTAKDIYTFLRKWWMDHIVVEDQKYGVFLKGKGVV